MKVKVVDVDAFGGVFGADCFLENFPQITTEGVEVRAVKQDDDDIFYYICNNGEIVHDSTFFGKDELKMGMELIE